ncbi:MAG TPA: HAD hydrolase-like protein [Acidobacteriaceae bacterium]|nr:HAD hydrolase-like protein [Acidobacteriaceae bacterium]
MSLRTPWLVVFDLDGTLIDSSLDLCLAVNAALAHVGAPILSHELITTYIGDGAAMLVWRALSGTSDLDRGPDQAGRERDSFERALHYFLEYYREHKLDNTRTYEGVLPALEKIRSDAPKLPMAILTNKPVNPSREICEALGLAPFFFANYGGNSLPTKKPDPAGLHLLMQEAEAIWRQSSHDPQEFPPDGVVMVGDSEADVLAGRHAGARTLGCRYGLAPNRLPLACPDMLCDSPSEWPRLLGLSS